MGGAGTQADYARHRGCAAATVSLHVKAGWFPKSTERRHGKIWFTDFALADQEWEAHADRRQHPDYSPVTESEVFGVVDSPIDSGETPLLDDTDLQQDAEPPLRRDMNRGEFQAVSAFWQAKQSKLNYLREAKEVGDVADFESFWAKTISESRAKILGIPTRFKQACPELLAGQMAALNQIVRECLEALGRDG